jgi:hypothetical protein
MTDDRMALIEAVQKADHGNSLRAVAETVLQIIMDADVEALIGAGGRESKWARARSTIGYGRLLRRHLWRRRHLRRNFGLRKDIRRQLRHRWGLRWHLGLLRCLG